MGADMCQDHPNLFKTAALLLRRLKDKHPEYIVDCIMLILPRHAKIGALGKCSLLPEGLGNPALLSITEDMVNNLIVPMGTSKVFDRIKPNTKNK